MLYFVIILFAIMLSSMMVAAVNLWNLGDDAPEFVFLTREEWEARTRKREAEEAPFPVRRTYPLSFSTELISEWLEERGVDCAETSRGDLLYWVKLYFEEAKLCEDDVIRYTVEWVDHYASQNEQEVIVIEDCENYNYDDDDPLWPTPTQVYGTAGLGIDVY